MANTRKAKINELVSQYKKTGNEQYFETAFNLCEKQILTTSRKYARDWNVPLEDFISEANYRFHTAVQAYDSAVGDFENILNRSIRNAFISMTRSTELRVDYTDRYVVVGDSELDLFEDTIIDGVTTDSTAEIVEISMTERKKELVKYLLSDADPATIETVVAYLTTGSLTKAGAQLGVNRTTIKRRIESLANNYDIKRFGDINDYLEGGDTLAKS